MHLGWREGGAVMTIPENNENRNVLSKNIRTTNNKTEYDFWFIGIMVF